MCEAEVMSEHTYTHTHTYTHDNYYTLAVRMRTEG